MWKVSKAREKKQEKTKRDVKLLEEKRKKKASKKCTLYRQQNQTSILRSLIALLDVKTEKILSPEALKVLRGI